ncbi:DUF3426 domain-containing protein [Sulfurisoma sediminicola]|uniref:Putative Zn finger-like uncharacterized protein n=1 Tax=Sulfurisoma sediminicola TaxID=1381557 RepID=A0A497XJ73_9PROT|nr:DUF3426 domain-containing protein [Sulfurisoma sediminicola]RLJ67982.1 putative Zn finger-like uncharacterized protein [Sulfurisoma sediminicola]
MLTRCPSCATTFRISPEQLKARQGRVRCGKCRNVFNALETLVEEPPKVAPPAEETIPKAPPATATEQVMAAAPATQTPAEVTSAAEPAVPPAPSYSKDDRPARRPRDEQEAPPAATMATEDTGEPETLVDFEPAFESLLTAEPRRRTWLWVLASLLALSALALQAVLHFRVELAVRMPETKPALQSLCNYVGCDLPLPRKVELVAIESSDLHPDPTSPAQLQLVATLRNRADFTQAYPHLELTLTDTADKALLRRALAPADYLPRDRPATAGFAANGELAVSLNLAVTDLAPVGYRLYVFYP